MKKYDVIIVGAGPAGLAAALTFKNTNLKVALFDKDSFPREKICGDGLCDRSINTVKAISEEYYNELISKSNIAQMSTALLAYKKKEVKLSMNMFGYIMPRYEFDNFLMEKVKGDAKNVDIYENTNVVDIVAENNSTTIITKNEQFTAPINIIANGFMSKLSEKLTGEVSNKQSQAIGIRAYYSGVKGVDTGTVEFHINKKYFPGYLWIFPLKNGLCNVGYGYHMSNKPKVKTQPKYMLEEWISNDSKLQERFAEAKKTTKQKGAYIPVSELDFNISGDNYMLCGDAATLVDPITGGGIGNGLLSGHFAALQAVECHKHDDFTSVQTVQYSSKVQKRMEKDMAVRIKIKKMATRYPILLDLFFGLAQLDRVRRAVIKWHTGK